MDARLRRRRQLLIAQRRRIACVATLAIVAFASCKAGGLGEGVGSSSRIGPGAASTSAGDSGAPAPTTDVLPHGYATTFRKLTPTPIVSEGHGVGRYTTTVFANETAAVAYESGRALAAYPAGAVFVAEHAERASRDAHDASRGPTFLMERRAAVGDGGSDATSGAWRFVAVDAEGRLATDDTAGPCAACHAEAARDSVFPLLP